MCNDVDTVISVIACGRRNMTQVYIVHVALEVGFVKIEDMNIAVPLF